MNTYQLAIDLALEETIDTLTAEEIALIDTIIEVLDFDGLELADVEGFVEFPAKR